jgi:hypothetical protein
MQVQPRDNVPRTQAGARAGRSKAPNTGIIAEYLILSVLSG